MKAGFCDAKQKAKVLMRMRLVYGLGRTIGMAMIRFLKGSAKNAKVVFRVLVPKSWMRGEKNGMICRNLCERVVLPASDLPPYMAGG